LPRGNQYAQATLPVIPSRPNQQSPAAAPPPLGAPPRIDSPPISVPPGAPFSTNPAGVPALVDSYDEEAYICRLNDTFETICEQFYHAKKYDRALFLFNRNHPRGAESLRQDPPRLVEGQPIYIPPLRILEKQFASAIADMPSPQNSGPPSAAGSGSSGRLYRVRAGSEGFWQIAQRTLGKGERWIDIWRLNAKYRPEDSLPGGTVLQLPPDAQVEPQDVP
jgi:nucleoid-associated protein YgaU